jgi:hypothetical protein
VERLKKYGWWWSLLLLAGIFEISALTSGAEKPSHCTVCGCCQKWCMKKDVKGASAHVEGEK